MSEPRTSLSTNRHPSGAPARWAAPLALALVIGTLGPGPSAAATGTDGRTGSYDPPPVAAQPTPSFAVGLDHVVVIGLDRRVYGAGGNQAGQLTGQGGRATLTPLSGLPAGAVPRTVAAGDAFSLVLTYDGRVFGAGANTRGQLTGSEVYVRTLTELTGLPPGVYAADISAGTVSTLVLGSDGVAYGTGMNDAGQLTGTGDRHTLTPLTWLGDQHPVTAIAAGFQHSLVVAGGAVYGTGRNYEGELTGSTSTTTLVPVTGGMPDGTVITDVAAGQLSSYLLTSQGEVLASGGNAQGQLGTGFPYTAHSLVRPEGLPPVVTHLDAQWENVLALGADGTPYVAGADNNGQLGGRGRATLFVPLAAGGPAHQAVAGRSATLVRDLDGVLSGVGENTNGMLTGAGPATAFRIVDGQVFGSIGKLEVSGPAAPGGVRTAAVTGIAPAATERGYGWTRDGALLPGATGPAYLLSGSDGGTVLAVSVRLGRPGFVPVVLASPGVAVGLAVLQPPRVHGVARPGRRLRANLGQWASGPVQLTVTWLRDGRVVPGHAGPRFGVRRRDVGHRLTVVVTATRPGFASAAARSGSIKVRPPR